MQKISPHGIILSEQSTNIYYSYSVWWGTLSARILVVLLILSDGIPQDEEEFLIALPLFVTYVILSIVGIIFAMGCLIFNLWYRNQK